MHSLAIVFCHYAAQPKIFVMATLILKLTSTLLQDHGKSPPFRSGLLTSMPKQRALFLPNRKSTLKYLQLHQLGGLNTAPPGNDETRPLQTPSSHSHPACSQGVGKETYIRLQLWRRSQLEGICQFLSQKGLFSLMLCNSKFSESAAQYLYMEVSLFSIPNCCFFYFGSSEPRRFT
jgi:hypothetical protein